MLYRHVINYALVQYYSTAEIMREKQRLAEEKKALLDAGKVDEARELESAKKAEIHDRVEKEKLRRLEKEKKSATE